MRSNLRSSVLLCALLSPALGLAAERYSSYSGAAVGYKDGQPLYQEQHVLRFEADTLVERVVLYQCPGSTAVFARKRMQVRENPLQPSFEMRDARIGYVEGFKPGSGADWEVYFQRGAEQPMETETLKLPQDLVADAGFDSFVRARWDELLKGDKVRFDFLVPSRLDFLSFKVQRLRADSEDGVPAQVFRLSLSGVLGWFLDGIDVWYADDDRSLLRFDGLSNVRDEKGDNYTARIRFPRSAIQSEVAAEVFADALAQPLVERCSP